MFIKALDTQSDTYVDINITLISEMYPNGDSYWCIMNRQQEERIGYEIDKETYKKIIAYKGETNAKNI